ncbi:NAD-P-binding protein [Cubamyces menziesii]|nr:NAD-P-binding protein [Cubamyces menziesii]
MPSTSRPTTWLITGASRGIGYELVRQLVSSSDNLVVAACRTPEKATALHALKSTSKGQLRLVQMDTGDFGSIRASFGQVEPILGEIGLDYLINNAGHTVQDTPFILDPEALVSTFRVNAAGPALVSQVYLPLIEKSNRKVILNVSSEVGSIMSIEQLGLSGMFPAYAMSKAALNMLVNFVFYPLVCQPGLKMTGFQTVKQKGARPDLIAITLCPGHVKTDMGGPNGALEPEESVAGILKVVTEATSADSGKYLRYNGETIPW